MIANMIDICTYLAVINNSKSYYHHAITIG